MLDQESKEILGLQFVQLDEIQATLRGSNQVIADLRADQGRHLQGRFIDQLIGVELEDESLKGRQAEVSQLDVIVRRLGLGHKDLISLLAALFSNVEKDAVPLARPLLVLLVRMVVLLLRALAPRAQTRGPSLLALLVVGLLLLLLFVSQRLQQ
jgi:hypothetical protein